MSTTEKKRVRAVVVLARCVTGDELLALQQRYWSTYTTPEPNRDVSKLDQDFLDHLVDRYGNVGQGLSEGVVLVLPHGSSRSFPAQVCSLQRAACGTCVEVVEWADERHTDVKALP